ncbi:MAG: patatin-like phospholipase family protein [Rhodanobacteraceae bacterium]|nr:patatin-like phospholipase family protein [Rhodanobacteraceae bacterium]
MRVAVVRFALLCVAWMPMFAATAQTTMPELTPEDYAHALPSAPRIGLVLGGGGARGAAHIGVLKVLEREHIPIHAIAGTSMGSIVGGFYAAGYTPEEIEAVIASIDWKDFFSDDPARADLPMRRKDEDYRDLLDFKLGLRDGKLIAPRGVLQGQKFLNLLRRMLMPYWRLKSFDDLPIPFRAIGTDIGHGEQVVFKEGDLSLAIRASMSVPGAFAPIRVDGRLMVDGGIVNNVPVDIVKAMGVDRVIVVDVGEPLMDEDALSSPLSVTLQMITVLMKQRTDAALASMSPEDVLIRPDLGDMGSAEFDRAISTIAIGEQAATAVVAQLKPLALPADAYAAVRLQQHRAEFEAPPIEFLEVNGKRTRAPLFVHTAMRDLIGKPLDEAEVERHIGEAYGTGHYERILYKLAKRGDSTGLLVTPVDKGWGPNFVGFGLQLSDDFNGRSDYQLAAEATFTGLSEHGAEARVRADLGRITALGGEWYQPWGDRGQYYWKPEIRFDARNQNFVEDTGSLDARLRRAQIGARIGTNIGHSWRIEGGVEYSHNRAQIQTGQLPIPGVTGFTSDASSLVLAVDHDSLDDLGFPTRGRRGSAKLTISRPGLGSDANGEVLRGDWYRAFSFDRHRLLVGAEAQSSWGEPEAFSALATLGGFTRLSGFGDRELSGEHSALARAIYYRRFGDMSQLFALPAYIGASVEAGNVWADRDQVSLDSLVYAGSLFVGIDSPLGPIFFGYGQAEGGEDSFYLSFGSLFGERR